MCMSLRLFSKAPRLVAQKKIPETDVPICVCAYAPLSRRISLACRFPFGMWRPLLHGVNENQHGGARLRRWGCGIDKDLLTRSKCAGNPQPDSLKEAPPYVFKIHGGGTRCGKEVRLQRPAQRAHSSQCRPGWLDGQQAAGD